MKYRCHCGEEHEARTDIDAIIRMFGEYIPVTQGSTGKTFSVPRIYIAVHGLKEQELNTLGFKEVKKK